MALTAHAKLEDNSIQLLEQKIDTCFWLQTAKQCNDLYLKGPHLWRSSIHVIHVFLEKLQKSLVPFWGDILPRRYHTPRLSMRLYLLHLMVNKTFVRLLINYADLFLWLGFFRRAIRKEFLLHVQIWNINPHNYHRDYRSDVTDDRGKYQPYEMPSEAEKTPDKPQHNLFARLLIGIILDPVRVLAEKSNLSGR